MKSKVVSVVCVCVWGSDDEEREEARGERIQKKKKKKLRFVQLGQLFSVVLCKLIFIFW